MEPKPTLSKLLGQKAQCNEFCRVWIKELGFDKLSRDLYEIKEHTDKNNNYYDEITSNPRRQNFVYELRFLH